VNHLGYSTTADPLSSQSFGGRCNVTDHALISSALFFLRWFQAYPLFAQSPVPIQAELVQRLNASKVKVGDSVLAKLLLPWKSPACGLSAGAIIQGHVVSFKAHSKTEKTSEIGITFESGQCDGREMKPLSLIVAAVLGPLPSSDFAFDSEEVQPLTSAMGLDLNATLTSVKQASETSNVDSRRVRAPLSVMPGQVVGIPHLEISVGQGPDGASICSNDHRASIFKRRA
jgi:hypothetical protein